VASRPPTISFSNIFAFGGGVWGGAALKGKGNGGGMHARSDSGARPEAQSNSNAYASRSHHHALGALQVNQNPADFAHTLFELRPENTAKQNFGF